MANRVNQTQMKSHTHKNTPTPREGKTTIINILRNLINDYLLHQPDPKVKQGVVCVIHLVKLIVIILILFCHMPDQLNLSWLKHK